jgi:hypothetical protein
VEEVGGACSMRWFARNSIGKWGRDEDRAGRSAARRGVEEVGERVLDEE